MAIKLDSMVVGEKIYEKMEKVAKEDRNAYGRYCLRLPMLLRESGLSQAIGYLRANKSRVATDLARDFVAIVNLPSEEPYSNNNLDHILKTRQAWRASQWFKHLAQIYFGLDITDTELDDA